MVLLSSIDLVVNRRVCGSAVADVSAFATTGLRYTTSTASIPGGAVGELQGSRFLSGWMIRRALTSDDLLPDDLERLGRALRPFARRPAFVLSLVVVCTVGAMLLFLAVHAITG